METHLGITMETETATITIFVFFAKPQTQRRTLRVTPNIKICALWEASVLYKILGLLRIKIS
jgi:hypothetical protein